MRMPMLHQNQDHLHKTPLNKHKSQPDKKLLSVDNGRSENIIFLCPIDLYSHFVSGSLFWPGHLWSEILCVSTPVILLALKKLILSQKVQCPQLAVCCRD